MEQDQDQAQTSSNKTQAQLRIEKSQVINSSNKFLRHDTIYNHQCFNLILNNMKIHEILLL